MKDFNIFNNQKLLKKAFTHRSFLNEADAKIESNERLEFLGDSILSYVTSSYLFELLKDQNEGQLTNLRSVLTNTETLYHVAKDLNLGKHLLLSKGEEQNKGRQNRTILANTVEAVIGAIYRDQGLEAAREFILKNILEKKDQIVKMQGLKDPKSALQEELQVEYSSPPDYEIVEESGPDHAKEYVVEVSIEKKPLARGTGTSKQSAEKSAAAAALLKLKEK